MEGLGLSATEVTPEGALAEVAAEAATLTALESLLERQRETLRQSMTTAKALGVSVYRMSQETGMTAPRLHRILDE